MPVSTYPTPNNHLPTLHMLCGKVASGKSTLATQLSRTPRTVLLSEDTWLGTLFGPEMSGLADYVRCSARLRAVIAPHVVTLLSAGLDVVLDFPANTVETRRWMRDILGQCGAGHVDHVMHVFDVPDEVCLARLHARNAKGDHPFAPTDAQFFEISKHVSLPTPDEGFRIMAHGGD